jgi:hypothetical protein
MIDLLEANLPLHERMKCASRPAEAGPRGQRVNPRAQAFRLVSIRGHVDDIKREEPGVIQRLPAWFS